MMKLEIVEVNECQYNLKGENGTYTVTIEFYDLEKNPGINDSIFLNEKVLTENKYIYSFGALDSSYGKDIKDANDEDITILIMDNRTIYLKRLYG